MWGENEKWTKCCILVEISPHAMLLRSTNTHTTLLLLLLLLLLLPKKPNFHHHYHSNISRGILFPFLFLFLICKFLLTAFHITTPHTTMQLAASLSTTTTFKQAFLRSMLMGLNVATSSSSKSMSFEARKRAVKLAADVAMACARGRRAKWARALVADLSAKHQNNNGDLIKNMLGEKYEGLVKGNRECCRIRRSKKILRRSYGMCSTARRKMGVHASVVAKSMVKRRTKLLKKIIPGGEVLNGFSLLNEALDYVVSLQAQVELMRSLLKATQSIKSQLKDQLKQREGSPSDG